MAHGMSETDFEKSKRLELTKEMFARHGKEKFARMRKRKPTTFEVSIIQAELGCTWEHARIQAKKQRRLEDEWQGSLT